MSVAGVLSFAIQVDLSDTTLPVLNSMGVTWISRFKWPPMFLNFTPVSTWPSGARSVSMSIALCPYDMVNTEPVFLVRFLTSL